MRQILPDGTAPLSAEDRLRMLTEHIPYRLSLLRDGLRPPWVPLCQHTNQAFEAGTVSGRILLSFLGLGYDDAKNRLKHERQHKARQGMTDDVKVPDVGGRFAELSELSEEEAETIALFIQGAHKACAHFTLHSGHALTLEIYAKAVPIIIRLLAACLPDLAVATSHQDTGETGNPEKPMP